MAERHIVIHWLHNGTGQRCWRHWRQGARCWWTAMHTPARPSPPQSACPASISRGARYGRNFIFPLAENTFPPALQIRYLCTAAGSLSVAPFGCAYAG